MMKIKSKINTYLLIVLTMVFVMSCGGGTSNSESEEHEHAEAGDMEGMDHDMEGMDKDMEGMDHDMEGEDHEHAQGAGHMDHMNDVREWLKGELGDSYDGVVAPATEAQLAMGETTYKQICAACHGDTGKGDGAAAIALDPKPADFTDPAHSAYYSDMGRLHIIKNGVEGTGMVGWASTLNEEQIQSVYVYVRSLRTSDEGAGGHDDGDDHEH
jgi:mono/diheme cytochrome c family protein